MGNALVAPIEDSPAEVQPLVRSPLKCQYKFHAGYVCGRVLDSEWVEQVRQIMAENKRDFVPVCFVHLPHYVSGEAKEKAHSVRIQKITSMREAREKRSERLKLKEEKCWAQHGMTLSEYRMLSRFLTRCLKGEGIVLPNGRKVRVRVEEMDADEKPEEFVEGPDEYVSDPEYVNEEEEK